MKKLLNLSAAIVFSVVCIQQASAQMAQNQIVVSPGVGQSLVSVFFTIMKDALNKYSAEGVNSTSTPVLTFHTDYGISEGFSLGAAYSYQSLTVTYTKYTEYDSTTSTSTTYSGNFQDRYLRQNYGARALFHFGNGEDMDLYAGARVGYQYWTHTSNRPTDNITFGDKFVSRMTVQPLFGMRYFFNEAIGINLEIGAGAPYLVMGGLSFKFGGI